MKYKKFFIQINMPGMMASPCYFSSRNAAIRAFKKALEWHDYRDVITNAKSISEPTHNTNKP
jgi:hypothetical protein